MNIFKKSEKMLIWHNDEYIQVYISVHVEFKK